MSRPRRQWLRKLTLLATAASLLGCVRALAMDALTASGRSMFSAAQWGPAQGLSYTRIQGMAQTRDGYLWLGTNGGLLRFDGVEFTLFNTRTGDLRDDEVGQVLADGNGGLWIATFGDGLVHECDGVFTTYTTRQGLPDNFVRCLDRDLEGNLWVTTARGVARLRQGRFDVFTTSDGLAGNYATILCAQSSAGVFVGANRKLHRFNGTRFEVIGDLFSAEDGRLDSICPSSDGGLWLGMEEPVVKKWLPGAGVQVVYGASAGLSTRNGALLETSDGSLWIGASDGLRRVSGGRVEYVSDGRQVPQSFVRTLNLDREGSLWVGFESAGIMRLRPNGARIISTHDGLPDDSVRSLCQDGEGAIWVGTINGLGRIENDKVERYLVAGRAAVPTITSIAQSPDHALWLAAGGRLFRVQDHDLVEDSDWLPAFEIRALYFDADGRMWIAVDGAGLYTRAPGGHVYEHVFADIIRPQIRDLHRDRKGVLWVATAGGGVYRIMGDRCEALTGVSGLPDDRVYAVEEDDEGDIYLGTRQGLVRWRDGKLTCFDDAAGLSMSTIFAILDDGRGDLWLSGNLGICRVHKSRLEAVATGRARSLQDHLYGTRDGIMAGPYGRGIVFHSGGPAGRITLAFCSLQGLLVIDPDFTEGSLPAPSVVLEEMRVDRTRLHPGMTKTVAPGAGVFEAQFTAPSFVLPDELRFRYQLRGFDPTWVEAGRRRYAHYVGLEPGSYQFAVQALRGDGAVASAVADVAFVIEPHFYETGWFTVLAVSLCACVPVLIYRLRVRALQRREEGLRAHVAEALAQVKVLSGLVPICSCCKNIRDDRGYWNSIEKYLTTHSDAKLTHGMCPSCTRKMYPEIADDLLGTREPEKEV